MSKYRRIAHKDRCRIHALCKRGAGQENIAGVGFGRRSKRGESSAAPSSGAARLSVKASGSEGASPTGDTT